MEKIGKSNGKTVGITVNKRLMILILSGIIICNFSKTGTKPLHQA